ncbi:MAG: hypothetical protein JXR64_03400, partial [Spirochaetales bacterium]|nr:hypothetical protein [Spirochaetales bacterium]
LSESLDDLIDDVTGDKDKEPSYDLSDFALDSDSNENEYDLDDFSLDSENIELDEEEEALSEAEDFDLEDGELDLLDDMDLSPEVIEASTDIDDLPEMDIEEDIFTEEMDEEFTNVKKSVDLSPDLSSLLEKASATNTNLSIAVISLGEDSDRKLLFIDKNLNQGTTYRLDRNNVAITLNNMSGSKAAQIITNLIESAKDDKLEFTAGISSMNNRRVGENRLIAEAMKAAEKAEELSKDLLIFKPDPKKFTEYIKNTL